MSASATFATAAIAGQGETALIDIKVRCRLRRQIESVKPISYTMGTIDDNWVKDYPNLKGMPTWYLLDRNGVIREVIVGQEVISSGFFDDLAGE